MLRSCCPHVAYVLDACCTHIARMLHCVDSIYVPCSYRGRMPRCVVITAAAPVSPLQLWYHRCSSSITAAALVSPLQLWHHVCERCQQLQCHQLYRQRCGVISGAVSSAVSSGVRCHQRCHQRCQVSYGHPSRLGSRPGHPSRLGPRPGHPSRLGPRPRHPS